MNAVTVWFRDYWQYAVLLVLVAAGTVFVWIKAVRAHRAHQVRFHAEEEKLRRMTDLKARYSDLSEEVIAAAPQEDLLAGVALQLQIWLQKQPDMKQAFASLPDEAQYVYALDVFTEDAPRDFFKKNGTPLLRVITPAFAAIGLTSEVPRVRTLALMYDETDETTSLDEDVLTQAEKDWADSDLLTQIKLAGAEYIQKNSALFSELRLTD